MGKCEVLPGEPSQFLRIPGCDHARYMTLDYCHAFHLGYGMDMAASTIVLLAKLEFHEGRSMNAHVHAAFRSFSSCCKDNKRTTSISDFSKLDLDLDTASDLMSII